MKKRGKLTGLVMTAAIALSGLYYINSNENIIAQNDALYTAAEESGERPMLRVCGTPFGIKLLTEGVIVTALGNLDDNSIVSPAGLAGIQEGDIIIRVNGEKVNSAQELSRIVEKCDTAEIDYIRNGCEYTVNITPQPDSSGSRKLGVWIRDSTAGIGTMTFYDDKHGICAGLGHAVCDIDTGEILPLRKGEIVPAVINGVKKYTDGIPGELSGSFKIGKSVGIMLDNNNCGLFSKVTEDCYSSCEKIPLGYANEVQQGKAYILSTVEGTEAVKYTIEIEKIDKNNSDNKNMVIRITDEKLLCKTGGIVQGMSGSPIIQNGRLIGAVTHVFVNDPTHGYAIFAQTMYGHSLSVYENTLLEKAA